MKGVTLVDIELTLTEQLALEGLAREDERIEREILVPQRAKWVVWKQEIANRANITAEELQREYVLDVENMTFVPRPADAPIPLREEAS